MNSTLLPGVPDARAASYLILLSCVLPYVLSVIQQRQWSDAVRSRVALALCLAISAGILYGEGALTPSTWLTSATLLFALTATIYHRFAKANGAATLESVTTAVLRTWLVSQSISLRTKSEPKRSEVLPDEGEAPDEARKT